MIYSKGEKRAIGPILLLTRQQGDDHHSMKDVRGVERGKDHADIPGL